jgi:uncharacterized membrane protein
MKKKILSAILITIILCTIGEIIIVASLPNENKRFTEFYLLGAGGIAADYPTSFKLNPDILDNNSRIANVQYGDGLPVTEPWGRVTAGIINHEQKNTSYVIKMNIDGVQEAYHFQGKNVTQIGPIELAPESKWEQEVGVAPRHTGEHQKLEMLLFKNGENQPYLNLYFWIDAE